MMKPSIFLCALGLLTTMAHAETAAPSPSPTGSALLVSSAPELNAPILSAVYGMKFQGDQAGPVMILSSAPDLCRHIAEGSVNAGETRLSFAPSITDSVGNFYPTTALGLYEVTKPGSKLQQPTDSPLGTSTSLFASMTLQKFNAQCQDTAAHPAGDSQSGSFSLVEAKIPTYSGDTSFQGEAKAAFVMKVGPAAQTLGGVIIASYCPAISLVNAAVPTKSCTTAP